MKWITLLPALLLVACKCISTEVLESPQVTVAPAAKNKLTLVPDTSSIDVTNTTIKFY